MRNTIYKAMAASGIAVAAMTAAGSPALAAVNGPAHAVPQAYHATGPAAGLSVLPGTGPAGGSSQGLGVQQPTNPNPACLVPLSPAAAGPACQNRTSETTRNAINSWNFGGAALGSAAANLISSAVFGVPSLAIDIIQSLFHSVAG